METFYLTLIDTFRTIFIQGSQAVAFLTTRIDFLGVSPLTLITINGLVIFGGVAMAKWIIA